MIPLEARVIPGLDEFMLRIGHLKVLSDVVVEFGGSWSRIEREFAAALTRLVPIPADLTTPVVDYLRRKHLCAMSELHGRSETEGRSEYRYSDLWIESKDGSTTVHIRTREERSDVPRIWWQDLCLAGPGIRSRVGAVTTRGKAGSKTGVSHLCDWAMALDLMSKSGELSPEGRLIARLSREVTEEGLHSNPYLIGNERIVFGYLLLNADIDVFARLAPRLLRASAPIRKADGAKLFAETIEEIAKEAESSRHLSQGQVLRIIQQVRDLENAVRRGGVIIDALGGSSTAWHRTASRLESYVDLGFLEKGRGGEEELYEYVYYPTSALDRAVAALEEAASAEEWLEERLVATMFEKQSPGAAIDLEETDALLRRVAACLERPTAPLPITTLALGLAWLKLEHGEVFPVAVLRRSIEELARLRPELARLSRGRSGERAEFVSLARRSSAS